MIQIRRTCTAAVCLLALLPWVASLAEQTSWDRGLLFEVSRERGQNSYLFGTIHSENERVIDLPPPVRSAFDGAGTFVMEVIPDADAILRSMVTMVYTDGRSLAEVVGPSRFQRIVEAMERRGMGKEAIKDFKPWAIATILSVPPESTGNFLDVHLYKSALSAGKPVLGLETIDEQLAVLDDLSQTDQVALLSETLDVLDQLPEAHEKLLKAYLDRDLAELSRLGEEYLQAGDSEVGERFKTAALDVRNERMTERMLPLLEQGDHFVAVGALHLPGEDGILSRLRAKGFEVHPVY
jgi:uncharacterized protein YbaP (TraB family)